MISTFPTSRPQAVSFRARSSENPTFSDDEKVTTLMQRYFSGRLQLTVPSITIYQLEICHALKGFHFEGCVEFHISNFRPEAADLPPDEIK